MARSSQALVAFAERWFPDAYVFVLIAVIAVPVGAILHGGSPLTVSRAFGDGLWNLIPFTIQMALVAIGGCPAYRACCCSFPSMPASRTTRRFCPEPARPAAGTPRRPVGAGRQMVPRHEYATQWPSPRGLVAVRHGMDAYLQLRCIRPGG
ncbi:TIGR00366 family protein [Bradyrhizobium sp. ISRA435]|nr:TIGR00366 family protein [Bradyrhizobium sp. ISRA435]